jgi:hypothetical protein
VLTDAQVRRLRQKRMEGKTLAGAAAAAGMSVRSAQTWEQGSLPSESKATRSWQTRPDPFAEVWAQEVEPWLVADTGGVLEATTLLERLEARRPGEFHIGQLRTLQRRLRDWRAVHGPEREVFFPQQHVPGREAQIDFTHARVECRRAELGPKVRISELMESEPHQFELSPRPVTQGMVQIADDDEGLIGRLKLRIKERLNLILPGHGHPRRLMCDLPTRLAELRQGVDAGRPR